MTRYTQGLRAHAVALYVQGLSTREVAHQVGVSKQSVYDWVKRHGVVRRKSDADRVYNGRRRQRDYDELEPRAVSLILAGFSVSSVAKILNIGHATVRRWCAKNHVVHVDREHSLRHAQRIAKAYHMVVDGEEPLDEAAALFGVAESTIVRWVREYRKHIGIRYASIPRTAAPGAAGPRHRQHGD